MFICVQLGLQWIVASDILEKRSFCGHSVHYMYMIMIDCICLVCTRLMLIKNFGPPQKKKKKKKNQASFIPNMEGRSYG